MSDKKITVTTAPKNRIVVTKGGGYSTIDTLVELRDVSAANVINDDVLVYVAANGNFVFKEVPFVNAAFTKANAANVLAYTVGINANAYTNAVGFSGNSYSILVGASSNAWTNTVGIAGNNYSNAVGIVGNNFTISVGTAGNNFALYLGYSSNSWANTIGISGNNYSNTIGVAGNNYTNAVGAAGNNYTNLVGASANAWTNALVFSANSNAGFMANAANARANAVGVAGNNYTNAVGLSGNNYTNAVGVAGNNYTVFVGASSNAWANSVNVYSDATYFKKSGGTVSGSVSVVGNFGITGNLSVTGNTYFISTDNYRVSDPLIYLAGNNYTSDIVDIGFIANYVNTTGANVHTGLYREHENKEWYLFQGYDKEPDNNHIGALSNNMTLAILNADLRTSNLILGGTNAISWISSAFSKANNALANTSGVSFAGDLTIPGKLYITIENADALRTRFISGKASGSTANGSLYLNYDYNDPVRVGSGTVRTDFYVANGRIGIGTSSPAYPLDVNGSVKLANTSFLYWGNYDGTTVGASIRSAGNDGLYLESGPNGPGRGSVSIKGYNNSQFETALGVLSLKASQVGSGYITLDTAGSERVRVDASGNVGIGTSSPSSKLQVNGTITIANTGLVESFRSGANTINLNMYNEANGTLSWEGSAGQLFSITNDLSGSLFTVNDVSGIPSIEVDALGNVDLAPFGGNVGIGTSNPVFKLDVNGDARITGNLTLGDATTDTITVNAANFNLANNISFDSGTLFIDKNNDRIGIGTTSPAYKLDVVGIVNTSDQFRSIGTGGDFRFNGGFGGTVAALGTVDNKPFMMFTNNTERMRIDASGNVGIGTTSVGSKLTISRASEAAKGQLELRNEGGITAGNYDGIFFTQTSAGTTPLGSFRCLYTSSGSPDLAFFTRAGSSETEKVRITNSGDLGIGTTTPTSRLSIVGGSLPTVGSGNGLSISSDLGATRLTIDSGNQTSFIGGYYDSNALEISQGSSSGYASGLVISGRTATNANVADSVAVFTRSVERMRVTGDGNVGIGTTSPTANLHVIGTANVSSTIYTRDIEAPFYSIYNEGAGAYVGIKGNYLRFGGVSEFMRIANTSGFVGIGTTSPAYKLDVANGTLVVTGTPSVLTGATGPSGIIIPNLYGAYYSMPNTNSTIANYSSVGQFNQPSINSNGYTSLVYGSCNIPIVRSSLATDRVFLYGSLNGAFRNSNNDISTATNSFVYGSLNYAGHWNSANTSSSYVSGNAFGAFNAVYNYNGTITTMYGAQFSAFIGAAANYTGSATTAYGVYINGTVGATSGTGTGTLTNYYDAYLAGVTVAATGTVTNKYGVYQAATDHINYFAGNVGIGTTAPGGKLTVAQPSGAYTSSAPFFSSLYDNTQHFNIYMDGNWNTHLSSIQVSTNQSALAFDTNGSERMRITANGTVGIGTSSPSIFSKLDVNGYGKFGTSAYGFFVGTVGSNAQLDAGPNAITFYAGSTEKMRLTSDGDVLINQTSSLGTGKLGVAGRIAIDVNGSDSFSGQLYLTSPNGWPSNIQAAGPSSNGIAFWTYTGSWSERVRITGAGNVGINTSSPSSRLHVVAANSAYTDSGIFELGDSSRNGLSMGYDGANNWSWIYSRSVGVQSRPISFNNSTLHIGQSGGAVGINTSAPSGTFQTAGSGDQNIYFSHTDNAAGRTVTLRLGSSNQTYLNRSTYIQAIEGSGIDNYSLAFGTALGTDASAQERMRITREGNIGVGTTSPGDFGVIRNFEIANTSGSQVRVRGTNVDMHMQANDVASVGILGNRSNHALMLKTNDAERMRIDSSGQVGIGTGSNTLYTRFTVSGGNQDQWEFNSSVATYNGGTLEYINRSSFNNRPDMTLYVGASNSNMKFATAGAERMRIDSTGNVAIGQTSAPERLTVFRDTDNSAEIGRAHIGYIGFNDYAGFSHVDQNITTNYALLQQSTGQTYLNSASGAPIYFRHGNIDQMTLSAGNLGIGTTSPTGRLDVWTVGSGRAIQTNPNDLGYAFTTFNASAGNAEQFNIKHNLAAVELRNERGQLNIVTNTANPIVFYTANTAERMRINTNGNVGIGNTAPDALLHVAGTTILGGDTVGIMDVKFSRSLGGTRAINHWFTHSANSPWYLFGQNMTWNGERTGTVDPTHAYRPYYEAYAPVVGYKEFGFANVSSGSIASSNLIANMVLTNTGNIGMGTLAPTEKLHVVGNILLPHSTANTGAILGVGSSDNFTTSGVIMPHYGLKWASPNDSVGPTGFLSAYYGFRFFVAGAEAMRIDANTRNVGIGNTSPTHKLEVEGTGRFGGTVDIDSANPVQLRLKDTSASSPYWVVKSSSGRFTVGEEGVADHFSVVKTTGNVGIGTTTPSERLEVNGNVKANSYIMANSAIAPITVVTTTTANQIIDSFANTTWRSAQYNITMTSNTDYHTTQISLIHDGANAYITEYGTLSTANDLGSFSATVTSGTVRLNVVPTFANTTINMLRTTNK